MSTGHRLPAGLTLEERIITLLTHLAKRGSVHVNKAVRRHQLTRPQALLLRSLEAPMRMNQVAMRLDCEPSNVTGIVDRLEARGLIQRVADPADRRVSYITVTPKGKRVRDSLATVAPALPGFDALSESDKHRLHDLLVRLSSATKPAG